MFSSNLFPRKWKNKFRQQKFSTKNLFHSICFQRNDLEQKNWTKKFLDKKLFRPKNIFLQNFFFIQTVSEEMIFQLLLNDFSINFNFGTVKATFTQAPPTVMMRRFEGLDVSLTVVVDSVQGTLLTFRHITLG